MRTDFAIRPSRARGLLRKVSKIFRANRPGKEKRSRALTQLRLAIHTPAHLPPTIKRTADGRYYRANHGKNFTSLPRHILTHRAEAPGALFLQNRTQKTAENTLKH